MESLWIVGFEPHLPMNNRGDVYSLLLIFKAGINM